MANVPISAFTVPANTVGIGATGYSLTGSANASLMDLAGTWNTTGTPTAIKLNITDTASNAASLLMDLQVGGASFGSLAKNGTLTAGRYAASGFSGMQFNASTGVIGLSRSADGAVVTSWNANSNSFNVGTATVSATLVLGGSTDLFLTRRGAANLRLGAADAAAPVAQTLSVQSVVAGTTNTAGTNFTITGSQGTGTGAGGSLIFQVAPAGTAGSTPNALVNGLRVVPGAFAGATSSTNHILVGTNAQVFISSPFDFGIELNCRNNSGYAVGLNGGTTGAFIGDSGPLAWSSTQSQTGRDLFLARDAANTLALRNGAAAQTFNVYNTFTDASNYERGFVGWASNTFKVGTNSSGTGSNRTLRLFGVNGIEFATSGSELVRWRVGTDGNLVANTDNAVDIGAVSATRPRNVYVGTSITPGAGVVVASLPTPSTGMIARVTDATAPVIGMTVAGGGAAYALVNYNGANWTVIGV